MICPVCKHTLSQHALLGSNLPAYRCENCGGIWISAQEYMRWLRQQKTTLLEKPIDDAANIPTWDTPQLKICPTCKHFLIRYRVLPNLQFYLDRCGNCNGVWFDKNEWEVLVNHNLHDKVNQFFTQPWQSKVREEEARITLDKFYLEKFGAADYTQLKDVRAWLEHHPQRSMLLAYLQSNNPYKP